MQDPHETSDITSNIGLQELQNQLDEANEASRKQNEIIFSTEEKYHRTGCILFLVLILVAVAVWQRWIVFSWDSSKLVESALAEGREKGISEIIEDIKSDGNIIWSVFVPEYTQDDFYDVEIGTPLDALVDLYDINGVIFYYDSPTIQIYNYTHSFYYVFEEEVLQWKDYDFRDDIETNVTSSIVLPSPDKNYQPTTPLRSGSDYTSEGKVWVPTRGGSRYHRYDTCSNMIDPYLVPIEEAIEQGFTPCGRCHPPE